MSAKLALPECAAVCMQGVYVCMRMHVRMYTGCECAFMCVHMSMCAHVYMTNVCLGIHVCKCSFVCACVLMHYACPHVLAYVCACMHCVSVCMHMNACLYIRAYYATACMHRYAQHASMNVCIHYVRIYICTIALSMACTALYNLCPVPGVKDQVRNTSTTSQ